MATPEPPPEGTPQRSRGAHRAAPASRSGVIPVVAAVAVVAALALAGYMLLTSGDDEVNGPGANPTSSAAPSGTTHALRQTHQESVGHPDQVRLWPHAQANPQADAQAAHISRRTAARPTDSGLRLQPDNDHRGSRHSSGSELSRPVGTWWESTTGVVSCPETPSTTTRVTGSCRTALA